ncbi:DNA methyltransferase [Mycoplasmopsis cynos]|nr:DNA methyltransferase [Mycoplasmopsis cynos]
MLKWILTKHINKNAKVLDFFAGSMKTTAHAVLDLNKEDGGNRTFTLVTNNENNIGIDVNYERLYRINHGI